MSRPRRRAVEPAALLRKPRNRLARADAAYEQRRAARGGGGGGYNSGGLVTVVVALQIVEKTLTRLFSFRARVKEEMVSTREGGHHFVLSRRRMGSFSLCRLLT